MPAKKSTKTPNVAAPAREIISPGARQWSPLQLAVYEFALTGSGHAVIEAVAGSGKSTTLVETCRRLIAANPNVRIALMAFNSKAVLDLQGKLGNLPVDCMTFHAAGKRQIEASRGQCFVDGYKCHNIFDQIASEDDGWMKNYVTKLVTLAKDTGIGFIKKVSDRAAWEALAAHHDLTLEQGESKKSLTQQDNDTSRALDYCQQTLTLSNTDRKVIDFSDMLYQAVIHRVQCWKYDFVFIDEAQDSNPCRRALAEMMLKEETGRLVAVGDPYQAIYGFTGADNDSLEQIVSKFKATRLPLSVCYRCGSAIVEYARQIVPHIESFPNAKTGSVEFMAHPDFLAQLETMGTGDAILCRKNAPLVKTAFALLRKGIGCRIEGRDIAANLIKMASRWKSVSTLTALSDKLEKWAAKETATLEEKGHFAKMEALADRMETLAVLIERATETGISTVEGLTKMISGLFSDAADKNCPKNLLTLCSIHKSKGMEWGTVFLLGRDKYMPSKFARQQWQMDQERNLAYVAVTRAMNRLVEVTEVPYK